MTTAKGRILPVSKRGFSFETIMWAFTRFSVIAIYGLMILGIIAALIMSAQRNSNLADILRWAFFPNITTNPLGAAPWWVTALAKLTMIAFLAVVSGHGVHGIIEILDDFFTAPSWRQMFRNAIITFVVISNIITIYVIWTS
jgi:succinate dehydrogenase hydrophobic anchor subunit